MPFLLIVLLALAALLWMPETGRPGQDTLRQYLARTSRAIREPRLTLAFATGFLRFFLDYGLYTYLPILVALRYGAIAGGRSASLIAVSAVGSIITAISIGRIYGRVATETAARAGVLRERASASACPRSARRCGSSPSGCSCSGSATG